MMKRLISTVIIFAIAITASLAVMPPASVSAAGCTKNPLIPQWYDDMCNTDGSIKSPAEIGGKTGQTDANGTASNLSKWIGVIAMNIVKILMTIVGYVSLGFIIWGGFKYMINGDNASGTTAARKTIQNAVIGLVLSIMSIAIINFITGAISA